MILRTKAGEVIESTEVNGVDCLTIGQFAKLVDKNNDVVRRLVYNGNRYRKLNTVKVGNLQFIPVSEIKNFPFTFPGRKRDLEYRYDIEKDGSVNMHLKVVQMVGQWDMG